jgi:hypothetical protein
MQRMLGVRELKAQDLHGLTPEALTALAAQMLEHIGHQHSEIERRQQLIEVKQQLIERKDRDIAWRDAKLEKVNFCSTGSR